MIGVPCRAPSRSTHIVVWSWVQVRTNAVKWAWSIYRRVLPNQTAHLWPVHARALAASRGADDAHAHAASWFKMAPTLSEDPAPWPTTANLEAWHAPAKPG